MGGWVAFDARTSRENDKAHVDDSAVGDEDGGEG